MATKTPAKKVVRVIPVRRKPARALTDAQEDAIDVAYIRKMEKVATPDRWIEKDEMHRRLGFQR